MNDNDAVDYFNALVKLLNNKNAAWVVEQANEEIRFGKLESGEFSFSEEKTVNRVFQERLLEQRGRSSIKKKEKLNQIIPFTPQERLILLIKAIRRLIIDTSTIQEKLVSFVDKEIEGTSMRPEVRFYSEEIGQETFALSKAKSDFNEEAVNTLKSLLSQLEHEAENAN